MKDGPLNKSNEKSGWVYSNRVSLSAMFYFLAFNSDNAFTIGVNVHGVSDKLFDS